VLCSSVAGNLRGNMRVVAIRSAWENAGRRLEPRSGLVEPTGPGTLDAFSDRRFSACALSRHVLLSNASRAVPFGVHGRGCVAQRIYFETNLAPETERELAGRLSPRDPKFKCYHFVDIDSFVLDLPQHSRLLDPLQMTLEINRPLNRVFPRILPSS
jgi:hypothetical protein